MESTLKPYFIIFYTYHLREKGYEGAPFSSRLVSFFDRPFSGVYIGFYSNEPGKLDVYGVKKDTMGSHAVYKHTDTYNLPQYTFMKFLDTELKVSAAKTACEVLCKRRTYLSSRKMLYIDAKLSSIFGCTTMSHPTIRSRYWICSEFVSFVLQVSELIDTDFHPSYISPSELFLYLRYVDSWQRNRSYHPFTTKPKKREDTRRTWELSNAEIAYRYLMQMSIEDNIPRVNSRNCIAFMV